jgi:glycosyltransferase involved in cell wall biosynthesis
MVVKNRPEEDKLPARNRRIVHLTTVHRPFDPRIFHKQLGTLREAGFDAHLIAPHDAAGQRNGITLHPLPTGRRRWFERLLLHPLAFRKARGLDADLYQIHDPELLPVAFLLKRATGARVVYDMHEDYQTKGPVWGRLLRTLERWAFRWLDHVLLAERSYGSVMEGERVPHTFVLNYFKPLGSEEEPVPHSAMPPTQLLYTGTVSDGRGLMTMVDLATNIWRKNRPERIDIIGVCNLSAQRAAAETQVREHGLNEVVTRVGWDTYVPPSDMAPYYRRADVGLFLAEPQPNLVESMPTKFYEYLHYGLPILCTDVPLWREFVEENDCGAVVPPGDPDAVLDVLDRWRERPARYRACAQNARAAASTYRWEQMGERLVRLYRDLLARRGPAQ